MFRIDPEEAKRELDRRQAEILEGYGFRLSETTGKAIKFVPVPEGFFVPTDVTTRYSGRKSEYGGDCVVRAFAIALYGPDVEEHQYKHVYKDYCRLIREWAFDGRSNAMKRLYRDGTRHTKPDYPPHKDVIKAYAEENGFTWTATAGGHLQGGPPTETVHVRPDELPGGRLVLVLSKHYSAFIDGKLYDSWDTSVSRHVEADGGRGWRMVYGYYTAP